MSPSDLGAWQSGPQGARELFAAYPSGVVTFGAVVDGADLLMLASSFTVGVSYDPPMCSVAIQKSSTTWPVLASAPRLGVSALSAAHARSVRLLGSRDPRNRTSAVTLARSPGGAVFVEDATAWFECVPVHQVEAGDHIVVLLEVMGGANADDAPPLILHRGEVHETAAILLD
jgi:flavin reductase (DIM6/NTAB) family NADH-FMN oxidoreductase RutF